MGGATRNPSRLSVLTTISIHAPRGGSDVVGNRVCASAMISIHAPRGGSDQCRSRIRIIAAISIHAPRGGSDVDGTTDRASDIDFNPRSPWGERPRGRHSSLHKRGFQSTLPVGGATWRGSMTLWSGRRFQSTLPVGGATIAVISGLQGSAISIHAPRGGSDWGEQPANGFGNIISIHAPRGGSDHGQPGRLL